MEKYLNSIIETTRKLISFNSIQEDPLPNMPFGKANYDCLTTALNILEDLGFKTKNLDGYCGIADIGEGEDFGILGHLDIVPAGDGWDYDPFKGEIVDGVLYGRGVLDDKGPMVCTIYAIKKLLDEGFKPKKKIRLILGCNEESGWGCMHHYLEVEKMPETGFSPDADFPVIYLEKGILHYKLKTKLENVLDVYGGHRPNMVADSGTLIVKASNEYKEFLEKNKIGYKIQDGNIIVETLGISAHGSTPEKGDNALIKLFNISNNDVLKDLAKKLGPTNGAGANLNISDPESGNLTLNLGACRYSDGFVTLDLDVRYPIIYDEKYVTSKLTESLPYCEITVINDQKPLYVDKNSNLVQTLLKAYNNNTGENLEPIAIGGGTYARVLKNGVAFGPIFPNMESTIHQANERVKVDDLLRISKIYYEAIKNLCF